MEFLVFWLSNIPSFAAPFALGVLGMIICERSGVLNLGAEGFVLVGAMSGAGLLIGYGDFPCWHWLFLVRVPLCWEFFLDYWWPHLGLTR